MTEYTMIFLNLKSYIPASNDQSIAKNGDVQKNILFGNKGVNRTTYLRAWNLKIKQQRVIE